ncbi:MAG: diacylglycerol kinase [Rhizobiaceae bacterium]
MKRRFSRRLLSWSPGCRWRFFVTSDGFLRIALIGVLLLVIIVEVLNTAIEAACNALSREFHADIKIAKDCGSLAVLISMALAASVWGLALWRWLFS